MLLRTQEMIRQGGAVHHIHRSILNKAQGLLPFAGYFISLNLDDGICDPQNRFQYIQQ